MVTLVKCVMVYFGLQRYAISLKLKRNTRKKYSVNQRLVEENLFVFAISTLHPCDKFIKIMCFELICLKKRQKISDLVYC